MRALLLTVFSLLTMSASAWAYDIDTHFYNTYLMARMAGIRHEVAIKLSTYNEWIDQSWITSPMDPLPGFGDRKRRLYHFTQEKINRYRNDGKPGAFFGQHLNFFGLSQENNEMASELISYGMKTGNFALVGGGLHVLMDSWGHSQFSYALGHAEFGHWPDRPWFYYEKHRQMTRVLFQAMVTIRDLMPPEALDAETPKKSAEELYADYDGDADIQGLIKWDPFSDARFTQPALGYLFRVAAKRGIFKPDFNYQAFLDTHDLYHSGQDVRSILRQMFKTLFALPAEQRDQVVDLNVIFNDYLRGLNITNREFAQFTPEQIDDFTNRLVYEATIHQVAGAVGHDKLVDFEADTTLRRLEMFLRLSEWRNLIARKTGRRVAFKDDRKKVEGLDEKKLAQLDLIDIDLDRREAEELRGTEQITLSRWERLQWYLSIMKYDQVSLAAWGVARLTRGLVFNEREYGLWRASRGNLLYQHPRFRRLMTNPAGVLGVRPYKQLLSADDVAKLVSDSQARVCEMELEGQAEAILAR